MNPLERTVSWLVKELATLRRRLDALPAKPIGGGSGGSSSQATQFETGGGNLIYSGALGSEYGIAYTATTITAVPTAAPSLVAGGTPTGLSPGYLIKPDGSVDTTAVWLANAPVSDGVTTLPGGIGGAIPSANFAVSLVALNVPITGGGGATAKVYVLYWA